MHEETTAAHGHGERAAPPWRAILVTALALSGAFLLGQALWIEAKAMLAQLLLEHAWSMAQRGETRAKPWPWADTWPVARLGLPRENERIVVLSGASGRTMAFGPGHVDGTAAPGDAGNCVITAHRDTHFEPLQRLERGDPVEIETPAGEVRRYRVEETFVVAEDETSILRDDGEARLTLVTCWPFDDVMPGSPYRYVVVAKLE